MCEIRKALITDIAEVARVFRESFRKALPHIPDLHTAEEDLDYFENTVFPANRVFVATEAHGRRIIGFIAFSDDMVNQLYLLPEAANKGIGSALLNLAKQQRRPLSLWTFQCNQPARHFYTKHGFQVVRETDGADNEEREPDVLFEWRPEA